MTAESAHGMLEAERRRAPYRRKEARGAAKMSCYAMARWARCAQQCCLRAAREGAMCCVSAAMVARAVDEPLCYEYILCHMPASAGQGGLPCLGYICCHMPRSGFF